MGGVVRELELACRASRHPGTQPGAADPREVAHLGAWAEVLDAHGTTFEVDIVAGTSAGGLNGSLLATALAAGANLGDLRSVWSQSAALEEGKLVRPSAPTPTSSVLDGAFFAERIAGEIEDLWAAGAREYASDVTLFVTATALDPADRLVSDAAGHVFSAADHRCVYRFRRGTDERFDPDSGYASHAVDSFADHRDDLAVVTRASAGFPAAFEPVLEPTVLAAGDPELVVRRPADSQQRWLIDGGVLDNAPFGAVLDEIARRPATAEPIRRVVAYVAPSNGRTARPARTAGDGAPPPWTDVLSAAANFPSESDFRDDVDDLDRLLVGSMTTRDTLATAFAQADADRPQGRSALAATAEALYPRYRAARISTSCALTRRVVGRLGGHPLALSRAEVTLTAEAARAHEWLPDELPGEVADLGLDAADRAVRLLLRLLSDAGAIEAAENVGAVVDRVAALRHAYIGALGVKAEALGAEDRAAVLAGEPEVIGRLVSEAYRRVGLHRELRVQLDEAVRLHARALGRDPASTGRALLVAEVVTQALSPVLDPIVPPEIEVLRIGPDRVCPVVAREAPRAGLVDEPTGQRLSRLGERKLYGTRLGHFGAFGTASWRDHDWLWGRLDAVAHIGTALGLDEDVVAGLQERVLAAEGADLTGVVDGLHAVGELTDGELIARFAGDAEGREAIHRTFDAVVRLLGQDHVGLPAVVRTWGPLVQSLLQLQDRPPQRWPDGVRPWWRPLLASGGRRARRRIASALDGLGRTHGG